MSAPSDINQEAVKTEVKTEVGCTLSGEASSHTPQASNRPLSPPKEGRSQGSEIEPFHASTLEEMLMTPPFDMTPDTAAGLLSSLAEVSPPGQGLADILPVSFLSQLAGKLPEGVGDAVLPHLPLSLHSPVSDNILHSPLTPSQQTSAGDSEGRMLDGLTESDGSC